MTLTTAVLLAVADDVDGRVVVEDPLLLELQAAISTTAAAAPPVSRALRRIVQPLAPWSSLGTNC